MFPDWEFPPDLKKLPTIIVVLGTHTQRAMGGGGEFDAADQQKDVILSVNRLLAVRVHGFLTYF